jgi:hypothetical protein
MFNEAIAGSGIPKRLSHDKDPLFSNLQWKANPAIMKIESVRSVSHVPTSHPFFERKITGIPQGRRSGHEHG